MKHVLIVNNNMHIGGVQKALVNLLHEIHGDYEVTLLLFYAGGELCVEIPEDVQVITARSPFRYWGMTRHDAVGLKDRLARTFWAAATRLLGRGAVLRLAYPLQKKLGDYDAAVSYLHSGPLRTFYGGCNEFVLRCVRAKRKVTFLHCDFEKIHAASPYNMRIYQQFDGIAACSSGCRDSFLRAFPQLADKTTVTQNCQNYPQVRRLAQNAPVTLPTGRLNIVTVARFGKEKGILRAIQAVAALGEKANALHYYLIGDGAEYALAEEQIAALGLTETITLLGELAVPYGYMQAADVLLIPSFSEAAPMVIGEAACLGTPILTTETSSAREMVEQPGLGWVCENTVEGIQTGLEELLSRPEALQEKRAHMQALAFDNTCARKQFAELIEQDADR